MRLDPGLVARAPETYPAHGGGGEELGRQDRVDFADELVADLDCRFGDGAAELEVVGDVVVAAARRGFEEGRRGGVRCGSSLVGGRRLRPGARVGVLGRRRLVLGVGGHVGVRVHVVLRGSYVWIIRMD